MKIARETLKKIALISGFWALLGVILSIFATQFIFSNQIESNFVESTSSTSQLAADQYTMGNLFLFRTGLNSMAEFHSWTEAKFINNNDEIIWENKRKFSPPQPSIVDHFFWLIYSELFFKNLSSNEKFVVHQKSNIYFDKERTAKAGLLIVNKNILLELKETVPVSALIVLGYCFFWIIYLLLSWKVVGRELSPLKRLKNQIETQASTLNLDLPIEKSEDELKTIHKWFYLLGTAWSTEKKRAVKKAEDEILIEITRQVAHDIRSPLTALDMALTDLSALPEQKRVLVRMASERIHDIANNLLGSTRNSSSNLKNSEKTTIDAKNGSKINAVRYPNSNGKPFSEPQSSVNPQLNLQINTDATSPELVSEIVECIVSEKRTQFRDNHFIEIESSIHPNTFGLFANIEAIELARLLSNLINNAREAFADLDEKSRGKITVGLSRLNSNELKIFVMDNGCGMSKETLSRLGTKGFSFGKNSPSNGKPENKSGSGLGVYHAKTQIENWGGQLNISSKIGEGSLFETTLPIAKTPSWFATEIKLAKYKRVVVLDDDPSIHQIWEERLKEASQKKEIELLHFSSSKEFSAWVEKSATFNDLFLCDYELIGSQTNGLELIETLGLQKQSVLVTSRFSENTVREKCLKLEIKCLPKKMARLVPIGSPKIETRSTGHRESPSHQPS